MRKLQIWSHLLKKSLMENFVFCAVYRPVYPMKPLVGAKCLHAIIACIIYDVPQVSFSQTVKTPTESPTVGTLCYFS